MTMIFKQQKNSANQVREFKSFDGGKSWEEQPLLNLPSVSDYDLELPNRQYKGKTAGQVLEIDKGYFRWFIYKSKVSKKIRLALVRLWIDKPYIRTDEIYERPYTELKDAATLWITHNLK